MDIKLMRYHDILGQLLSYTLGLLIVGGMLLVPAQLEAQDQTVSGQVTSADDGSALPGVNVVVKGTNTGTSTNREGQYELTVPSLNDTLIVSFVGYQTREVPVNGRTEVNIEMQPQTVVGDEMVVVGYGTKRKENLTGSVSEIETEELTKVPVANSSQLVVGKVPGLVTKQTSAVPGDDATSMNIRGFGNPLVLVDGVQKSFNKIDPNDIESISVLKDASAAIYGAQAGNGVILVTTKRGSRREAPEISYHGNISIQQPTAIPNHVNAAEYAEMKREGELNYGLEPTFSEEDVEKYRQGDDPEYQSYDWYDALIKDWTPMQQHNINVSGGAENVRYYISTGFLDQASIFESDDLNFQRYNARSNLDAYISDNLTMSLDLSYRREQRDEPGASLSSMWSNLSTANSMYPPSLPDPTKAAYAGFLNRNALAKTQKEFSGFRDDTRDIVDAMIELEYDLPLLSGLSINSRVAYYGRFRERTDLDKEFQVYEYNRETDEYIEQGTVGSSALYKNFRRRNRLYPRVSIEYTREYQDHSFDGLLLAEMEFNEVLHTGTSRQDLLSPEIPYLFAGSEETIQNDESAYEENRASYIGRLSYSYKNKYLLDSSFRYDASSKFSEETRWGFFPSVSVGWRLSEEPFIQNNLDFIESLKLRLSYGKSGDDDVGSFQYLTGYNIAGAPYLIGNEVGKVLSPTGLPNPNITWLKMTTYNAGLDASFLEGLIGFEFDLFYREVTDRFGTPQSDYPSTFGATLPQLNINTTDDRGFEFLLKHQKTIGDFSYQVSANIGLTREKYVDWSEETYDDPDERRIFKNEGNYVNRWIGYVSDGQFMNQEEIDNHPIDQDQNGNTTLRPGDIKYKDLDGDSVITWRDQKQIGYGSQPDLTYGMNINLNYKGLSLTALFQGASMFNMAIESGAQGPFSNETTPYDYQYKYRWQPDPDNLNQNINPDAKLPAVGAGGQGTNDNNNKMSDFWLQDNTYLRLKNLNVGYALPNRLTSRAGINDLEIYIAGENLLTFSKLGIYKESFDPESPQDQIGRIYPPVKTITLGLKMSL